MLPFQVDAKLTGFLAFTSFLAALTTVTVGIAKRYKVQTPWALLGIACAAFLAINWFAFDLPRDSFLRMMLYQLPYATMQAICAGVIVTSRRRQPMDIGLLILFFLSALQFLSKPFVAQLTGGPGGSAQEYIGTNYALYSQSFGAVLSVGIGLLMLMLLVRDMLEAVTMRSETDPLSGLFNRRGFEDRVEPALAAAARNGVPAALVTCDLDHFKAVNDTWGHLTGDKVIQCFASVVRSTVPPRAICARMGGEEFAVFLPGANLAAARLYAESLRAAFATLSVEGTPEKTRFTASFGVAESGVAESLSDLRRRADMALYSAKRNGRDRVAVAGDPGIDQMPTHPLSAEPPRRRAGLVG